MRCPVPSGGCYNYSFSQFAVGTDANGLTGTAISQGNPPSANATRGAAGATFFRSAEYVSSQTKTVRNVRSTNTTSRFSSLTFTYTAPVAGGWEFLAIPSISFCVA